MIADFNGIWIHSSTKKRRNIVKVGPPLKKLSGSGNAYHERLKYLDLTTLEPRTY